KQIALQLLREDGTSIIVPITTRASDSTNANSNVDTGSGSDLNKGLASSLTAIGGEAVANKASAGTSLEQLNSSAAAQQTQLITISADSLSNLIPSLSGNMLGLVSANGTG